MTGNLNQNYNMTNLRNIKLKYIIIRWFLLYSLLFTTENIATSSDNVAVHNNTAMNSNNIATNNNIRNENTIYIITDSKENNADTTTKKYIACRNINTLRAISRRLNVYGDLEIFRNVYGLLFITGSIYTSLYNYFTEHNKRKNGWYRSKFFVYFGGKTNITKNFHLDLYFSLLNLCANLFVYYILNEGFLYVKFTKEDLPFIILILSFDINIRIHKNFYFCLKPMSLIRIYLLHNRRSLLHSGITKYWLDNFQRRDLPQNPNISNIYCWKPQEHTHFNTNNII